MPLQRALPRSCACRCMGHEWLLCKAAGWGLQPGSQSRGRAVICILWFAQLWEAVCAPNSAQPAGWQCWGLCGTALLFPLAPALHSSVLGQPATALHTAKHCSCSCYLCMLATSKGSLLVLMKGPISWADSATIWTNANSYKGKLCFQALTS